MPPMIDGAASADGGRRHSCSSDEDMSTQEKRVLLLHGIQSGGWFDF